MLYTDVFKAKLTFVYTVCVHMHMYIYIYNSWQKTVTCKSKDPYPVLICHQFFFRLLKLDSCKCISFLQKMS